MGRNYIRKYCWLINRSGKQDRWLPIDQGQEQNIKDIKVSLYTNKIRGGMTENFKVRSFGPGATWEYIQKVSPAIPTL
jgi:hypothetical protein